MSRKIITHVVLAGVPHSEVHRCADVERRSHTDPSHCRCFASLIPSSLADRLKDVQVRREFSSSQLLDDKASLPWYLVTFGHFVARPH